MRITRGVLGERAEVLGALELMIDVNLKGVLYTARAALPHLIAAEGGGDFVSLASVAGVNAFPGEAVYNASKFGQVGFVRSLDIELREQGVRCSNICPGGVATDFAIGIGREAGMPALDGMMSPDDVAEVVLFALTRPRSMRLMTTTFRPMSEGSWGYWAVVGPRLLGRSPLARPQ